MTTLTSSASRPAARFTLPGQDLSDRLLQRFAPLVGRILVGGMFAYAGTTKIGAFAGTQGYMESVGVPGALLPLVIAFEIGAGLALLVGWQMRWVAAALAGFTAITALLFHADLSDPVQSLLFAKNVAIAGGLLAFSGLGAGAISLDARAARRDRAV
jgi:putative oxidoreductase